MHNYKQVWPMIIFTDERQAPQGRFTPQQFYPILWNPYRSLPNGSVASYGRKQKQCDQICSLFSTLDLIRMCSHPLHFQRCHGEVFQSSSFRHSCEQYKITSVFKTNRQNSSKWKLRKEKKVNIPKVRYEKEGMSHRCKRDIKICDW